MSIFSFIGYTLTELFEILTIDDIFINKQFQFFLHQTITRLRNSCLITFLKKIQKQPPEGFCKKNFANFTEKHLCWSLEACKFYKKRLHLKCFLVKFLKLLRASILKNICKRLLLEVFYNKAVLKNFTIFTGRKWLVIRARSISRNCRKRRKSPK